MSDPFISDVYGPAVAKLLRDYRVPSLGPGTPIENLRGTLRALTFSDIFQTKPIRDEFMANACLTGLWLYFDFIREAHTVCQLVPTTTGNLWHAIIHRREPDYPNAKYWLRKVLTHPIYAPLQTISIQLASAVENAPGTFSADTKSWDPFAFIEICRDSRDRDSPIESLCRQIQRREWELLFDYCYFHAVKRTHK